MQTDGTGNREQGTVLLFDHAETGLNVKGNVLQALTVTVGEKEVHYSYEINGNQMKMLNGKFTEGK
ncbi:MAG: hypothetical protein LUI13_13015 [Lachnospiraceae bacterium]|nr:hypothetical protein [Lachnospiraceae bacterium]